jgi:MoxR-like ATPase
VNAPPTLAELRSAQEQLGRLRQEIQRVYFGAPEPIELLLIALLARGHALLEGVPGVAKTTLIKAMSAALSVAMRRIQFTPDLLPQDITGTYVLDPKSGQFSLRLGPLFANLVLADELNRAPAKTQSALLEAMQERQVTIEGERLELPNPFLVLATQNPIDLDGTFPLPEAQLDRFLVRIELGYPSENAEVAMLRVHSNVTPEVKRVFDLETCIRLSELSARCHVEDDVLEYVTALTRFTRNHPKVALGCSPRASLALVKAAQAHAVLQARPYVTPDDVRAVAVAVLAHRVVLVPELELELHARRELFQEALSKVPYRRQVQAR